MTSSLPRNKDCTPRRKTAQVNLVLSILTLTDLVISIADSIDEISLLISGQLGYPPVDVNSRNAVDRSALHWAAGNNNVDALKVLIQFGASVDAKVRIEKYDLFNILRTSLA
jgi:ankyrin repeat protein